MKVIEPSSINEALILGLCYLRDNGEISNSRNGPVLVSPVPVTTVYREPQRRVLLNPERDANPFFHLFEAMWILAGRCDVAFLQMFNSNIANYSDDGVNFNAPYGYRMRKHRGIDQISMIVEQLKSNKESRQAVVQIWDAAVDLNSNSKDLACNDLLFFRVHEDKLDITVCCRSNDIVWGAYGANVVQFSVLQEYVAAKIGVEVGTYYQISNNYHVYTDLPFWKTFEHRCPFGTGVSYYGDAYSDNDSKPSLLFEPGKDVIEFDYDLKKFFGLFDQYHDIASGGALGHRMIEAAIGIPWSSKCLNNFVLPMLDIWALHKTGKKEKLEKILELHTEKTEENDWFHAAAIWVTNRQKAKINA